MKRTKEILIGLLWALALANMSCATAGPIAIKCGINDVVIAANDYAEIKADIQSNNWADLAKVGESIGWATLDCVLGNESTKNPAAKPKIDEFRRLHSVEFRAAGVSACNVTAPGGQQQPVGMGSLDRAPEKAGNGTATQTDLVSGESRRLDGGRDRLTLARCDLACGHPLTGLVTSGACSCWRASATDWRASRWVRL